MSRSPKHVAQTRVNDSNTMSAASVAWQLSLDLPPKRFRTGRWWLVGASIWVANERNPRKQVVIVPDVASYLRAIETGRQK